MKRLIFITLGAFAIVAIGVFFFLRKDDTIQESSTIKIGAILPLTGERGNFGKNSKNGIELAISEMEAFIVTYEDSRSNAQTAVSAFHKLANDGIEIVVGPISSQEVLSIAPIAERSGIILFSPGASSPEITNAGDYIFRNVSSDVYEASLMAHFVYDSLNFKSIAILYNHSDYGIGVSKVFEDVFKNKGGKIFSESYADGANDFRTQLLKIKKENPEAVYFVGYTEMGNAVKQAVEMGIKARFITTAIFEDDAILKSASNAAENIIFTSITFDMDNPSERARKFVNAYKTQYNKNPDGYAAVSYDAIYILKDAVEISKQKSISIKDALYEIKDFPGLLGNMSFDENGDVILPIKLKTVKNGKFVNY